MRMILTTMAAACALGVAMPAAAQYVNSNAGGTVGISNRIAQLEARLDAGVRSGTIDRSEAYELRMDLRNLRRLERQYSRNGLTVQERSELQARLRDIRADIRLADGGGRYDDRYGAYEGQRYDRNGNRDPNGLYDRNGNRIDNGYYGQGGPYEDADDAYCEDRGGVGGVIDDVFGRGCSTLRVGARATSNLGAVPYQYRNQYRDGNGYYFRSDGRAIYQIDVRTNTVVRVYNMNR